MQGSGLTGCEPHGDRSLLQSDLVAGVAVGEPDTCPHEDRRELVVYHGDDLVVAQRSVRGALAASQRGLGNEPFGQYGASAHGRSTKSERHVASLVGTPMQRYHAAATVAAFSKGAPLVAHTARDAARRAKFRAPVDRKKIEEKRSKWEPQRRSDV